MKVDCFTSTTTTYNAVQAQLVELIQLLVHQQVSLSNGGPNLADDLFWNDVFSGGEDRLVTVNMSLDAYFALI